MRVQCRQKFSFLLCFLQMDSEKCKYDAWMWKQIGGDRIGLLVIAIDFSIQMKSLFLAFTQTAHLYTHAQYLRAKDNVI